MASCTFFGHRECPDLIKPQLRAVLSDLITNQDVNMFYVGNQGRFDAIVRSVLRELKKEYPQINYAVVLAYIPGKQNEYDDYSDTMLPEGIESVHPRYAISWRNNWMLRQSDYTSELSPFSALEQRPFILSRKRNEVQIKRQACNVPMLFLRPVPVAF